ncbi:MAG: putative metal-binding motif-containing protein [Myxococcota bacterium]
MRMSYLLALTALLVACNNDKDDDGYDDGRDCNDNNGAINPGQAEVCDGIDNDCDGIVDEGLLQTWYADTDADGFGDPNSATEACAQPADYTDNSDDCDDTSALFFPGAPEDDCADVSDYNCDGSVGYADNDEDGVAACEGDCDDTRPDVSVLADEICDEIDNDCDTTIDEDDAIDAPTWYGDADGDGFGGDRFITRACNQPDGYVSIDGDCNDLSADALPGGSEVCDGIDNDCDGLSDNDAPDAVLFYQDADEDGFGDATISVTACTAPTGFIGLAGDCSDEDAAINPAADEICGDAIDNNCDGATDDDAAIDAATWYRDDDNDGYGYAPAPLVACEQPDGYVAIDGDCNDRQVNANPGIEEVCDGIDNDCDVAIDEADAEDAVTFYADGDEDSFGDPESTEIACFAPEGYVDIADDCDDEDADINPEAIEVCNDGIDNNCDSSSVGCELTLSDTAIGSVLGETSGEGEFVLDTIDLNGDGIHDLIVGADQQSNGGLSVFDGAAFIFYGPLTAARDLSDADLRFFGRSGERDVFGAAVRGLEDFDDDGTSDIAITAAQMDSQLSSPDTIAGAAFIFSGASLNDSETYDAEDADYIFYGTGKQHYLSSIVSADFNEDDVSDVVLGAGWAPDRSTKRGQLYLVYGGVSAGEYDVTDQSAATFTGEADSDLFSLAALPGDVNGDDTPDLLMSAPGARSLSGTAYVAFGPFSGNSSAADADIRMVPDSAGDGLGADDSLIGIGDTNDDGYLDFVIGSSGEDTVESNAGAAFVFYGDDDLADRLDGEVADDVADAIIFGSADADIGDIINGGKDINGDDYADLIFGSPNSGDGGEGLSLLMVGPFSGSMSVDDADVLLRGGNLDDDAGFDNLFIESVDEDGTPGILVSVPEDDTNDTNTGATYLIVDFDL